MMDADDIDTEEELHDAVLGVMTRLTQCVSHIDPALVLLALIALAARLGSDLPKKDRRALAEKFAGAMAVE